MECPIDPMDYLFVTGVTYFIYEICFQKEILKTHGTRCEIKSMVWLRILNSDKNERKTQGRPYVLFPRKLR